MSVPARRVALAAAVGASLFHLYAAGVEPFTALVQRPVHLALMAIIGFLVITKHRHPQSISWKTCNLREKFPPKRNRLFFEIIFKGKIAKHVKKCVMSAGKSHIF